MSVARIAAVLGEAGTRLLNTLVDRAREYDERTEDPIYVIVEHWARDVLTSVDLPAVFRAACERFGDYAGTQERWMEALSELLEHGGEAIPTFAENLWRTYIFRLQDAPEALWSRYPDLQREAMIEGECTLPRSWGDWVLPMQTFMGIAEDTLIDQSQVFEEIIITEEVVTLLEEPPTPSVRVEPIREPLEVPEIPGEQVGAVATLMAYLTACQEQIGHIDPRGYPRSTATAIPISEVYTPLQLVPLSAYQRPTGYMRYQTATYDSPELHLFRDPSGHQAPDGHEDVKLQDALRDHRQVLILGESGAGKTMLLRHLVLELTRILLDRELHAVEYEARRDGTVAIRLARPLPVYVDLAQYADGREPDESLEDFVLRSAANMAEDDGVIAMLTDLAAGGSCLFLLDGLDQVATDEQRRMLVVSVTQAAAAWQATGNRVVVTGRLSGYDAAPLPVEFETYLVRGLDRVQIGSFIFRWSLTLIRAARPFIDPDEAHHEAEARMMTLLREVNQSPELHALVRNPLMLRLLVSAYRPGMILAPCAAGVYQSIADALIREWHLPRSATQDAVILEHEAVDVLGQLAFWLHRSRPGGVLRRGELSIIVGHIWRQLHPDADEEQARAAAEDLIQYAQAGTGVFIELAPQLYGFIYHCMQEYFAARYLVSSYRLADERIRASLHDPRWTEVIRLAIGFTALRSQDDASDLIETAILAHGARARRLDYRPSPFESLLARDLFFAASLLGSGIEVRPGVTQRIVRGLINLWLNGDGDSMGRFSLIFDSARRHLVNLEGTSASQYAFQIACEELAHHDEHKRAFAADAMAFWPGLWSEGCEALVGQGREVPPLMRRAMAHALGHMGSLPVEAFRLLLFFVIDTDEEVGEAARQALEKTGPVPTEALSVWVEFLRSGSPPQRRISLRVLRQIGTLPGAVVDELLHELHNPDREARQAALETLAGVSNLPDNALTAVCRTAMDTHSDVRIAAINALSRPVRLPDEVIEYLVEWTYDPEVAVRRVSAQALGTCKNDAHNVIEALVERLADPSDSMRAEAVELLARKGRDDPRVMHVLSHVIRDPIHTVRCAVASALRHFPEPTDDLRAALKTLLSDGEMIVRETTLETVACLREPGDEIINEFLIPLAGKADSEIGRKAVHALAAQRGLPDDEALLALANALLACWQSEGRVVAECLKAHTPLSMEVVNVIMDLAVSQNIGSTQAGRISDGLRALALEVLGCALEEAPDVTRVLLEAAARAPGTEVRVAALRGLMGARAMWPDVKQTLVSQLKAGPTEVRCAAGITLGHLIRTLPDPPFDGEELFALAEDLAALVRGLRPRDAWDTGAETQNELLLALSRVMARTRPRAPRLPARSQSEDAAGQFDEQGGEG